MTSSKKANKKHAKQKAKKRTGRKPVAILREETTEIVETQPKVVRTEPVTLARALGETAVVTRTSKVPARRSVIVRQRKAS